MKIAINCHTLVPPFTGVQQSILGMLESLTNATRDTEEEFTAYIPWGLDKKLLPEADNLQYKKSWAKCGNRTMRILWEQFSLFRKAGSNGADALIAPCYVMPLWSTVPTIVTIHDMFAFTHPQYCTGSNRSHFRKMLPETVKRATKIVTPTNSVKRDILDTFENVKPEKIEVIPWGVDKIFTPATDKAALHDIQLKYGLPPKFVLHVGRREPKKNMAQLIEAFFTAVLAEKLPHRLVLVGPKGWGVEPLKKLANTLGIGDRLITLGYVPRDDMPAIYSLADALAFPSLAEGFGLPVLEAMACGTAVIASNLRSLREVCDGAAHMVEDGSLPALREGLEKVLTDDCYRTELSTQGLARATQFTWEEYARKKLALCRKITGR